MQVMNDTEITFKTQIKVNKILSKTNIDLDRSQAYTAWMTLLTSNIEISLKAHMSSVITLIPNK